MAKVFGASGRYVTDQTRAKRVKAIIVGLATVALTAASAGFLFGCALPDSRISAPIGIGVALFLGIAALVLGRWCIKRMDALETERVHMQRGADGESAVARLLAIFPDTFCVINDLTTPFGNLDHVVVGPSGVFVIDTKNWRGIVSADGRGELLLNGKRTDKPVIRQSVSRMMSVRERVASLVRGIDPFYNALFVFTAARVEAKWGTTGSVTCLTDQQLHDYIVENKFGKRLSSDAIDRLTTAFLTLARSDPDFSRPASVPHLSRVAHSKPAVALP